jgi:hypothetical protein
MPGKEKNRKKKRKHPSRAKVIFDPFRSAFGSFIHALGTMRHRPRGLDRENGSTTPQSGGAREKKSKQTESLLEPILPPSFSQQLSSRSRWHRPPRAHDFKRDESSFHPLCDIEFYAVDIGQTRFEALQRGRNRGCRGKKKRKIKNRIDRTNGNEKKTHRSAGRAGSSGLAAAGAAAERAAAGRTRAAREERAICMSRKGGYSRETGERERREGGKAEGEREGRM